MLKSPVALFGLTGTNNKDEKVKISGLYDVLEYLPYEPSAYVWSPCYVLAPVNTDDEDLCVEIDADLFKSQVDPKAYGREIANEREYGLEAEGELAR